MIEDSNQQILHIAMMNTVLCIELPSFALMPLIHFLTQRYNSETDDLG